jgi:predicted peroxiredoxin
MAEEIKSKYPCGQDELYAITELAINNLLADKDAFHDKKAKYDDAFIDGLRDQRTAAMVLPDEDAVSAIHETLKNKLPGFTENCKDNFNDIKGYIRDGWPGEDPKPRYEAAGLIKYNKIGTNNWESVEGMNNAMQVYIAENNTILGTPGGMPATFSAKVDSDTTIFNTTYNGYKSSRETATATAAKVKANNNLYDAVMDFMKDGVEMVFRRDAEAQKRYVFSHLKDIVSPPGSSSLGVKVKNADDTFVTEGTVKIKKEGEAAILVAIIQGSASFLNVPPGKYDGTVTTVDGRTAVFSKEVEKGVNARITVVVPL